MSLSRGGEKSQSSCWELLPEKDGFLESRGVLELAVPRMGDSGMRPLTGDEGALDSV